MPSEHWGSEAARPALLARAHRAVGRTFWRRSGPRGRTDGLTPARAV